MTKYEDEYYLLFSDFAPGAVILQPEDSTAKRAYVSSELIPGKPLKFTNGFADDHDAEGLAERIMDVLFDAFSFAIRDSVKERLASLPVEGFQYYPMIYADRSGAIHTDYWYVNMFRQRPFLDRERSTLLAEPQSEEEEVFVLRYAFDLEAMDAELEDARLIFKMEGIMNSGVFIHERVLGALAGATGCVTFLVSEFQEGMQNTG